MGNINYFFRALAVLFLLVLPQISSAATVITTYGGTGVAGYSGDGGVATSAQLNAPLAIAEDVYGSVYIADRSNNRIRKIDPTGIITTIAGTGVAGFSGDGGAATAAQLNLPNGIAVDSAGNVFISDRVNNRIRKIDVAGTITTIAGTGALGFSGDGGAATAAQLSSPYGIEVDASGNLYIADNGNQRIRKIDVAGTITTIAGTGVAGFSGDGGAATAAQLNSPYDIAVDGTGNIYIADTGNQRIRKIDVAGTITTIAGDGTFGFAGDGGAATAAKFATVYSIALDATGQLLVSDNGNHRIRRIDLTGVITTIAGTGSFIYNGEGLAPTSANLTFPWGVEVDGGGTIFIAESSHRIRIISLSTPAPSGGTAGGAAGGGGGCVIGVSMVSHFGMFLPMLGLLLLGIRLARQN